MSEAVLEKISAEDEHVSSPQPASHETSSPRHDRHRKLSAADEVAMATGTSREPRPLTAMQQLL